MADIDVISPDGEIGSIPAEQLEAAKTQGYRVPGDATPPPAPELPDEVDVRAPDGSIGTVPRAQLSAAVEQGYTDLAQEKYQTGGQQLATVGEGLARGATMGVSDVVQAKGAGLGTGIGDWIADKVLGETPRVTEQGIDAPLAGPRDLYNEQAAIESGADIAGRREANRGLAIGSEIVGAVAPALMSGGVGSAAAAAKLTPAGQLANLATKMSGMLAPSLGKTAVGRITALAATGAAEGAIDAATRQVMGDLAAGNVDITAERALDAAWEGAKWGGLAAGGAGVVVEGAQAVGRGGRMIAAKARGIAADHSEWLGEQAGEAAYKAAVGRTSIASQRLADRVGGASAIGDTLLKKGIVNAGDTVDDIASRLPGAREEAGQALGSLLDEVADGTADGEKIWQRIEAEVIAPLEQSGTRDIAKAVRAKLEGSGIKSGLVGEADDTALHSVREVAPSVDPHSGSGLMGTASPAAEVPSSGLMGSAPKLDQTSAAKVTNANSARVSKRVGAADSGLMGSRPARDNSVGLRDLHELRRRFDQRPDLKWNAAGPNGVDITTDAMRDVRRTIEDAFEKASDDAARAKGVGDFAERLKQAKREYSHLALASKVAEQGSFSRAATNRVGLNDALAGVAGAAALGPAGALAAVGSKLIRDRSESVVAATLYKLAKGAVSQEQATAQAVASTISGLSAPAVARVIPIATRAAAVSAPVADYSRLVAQSQELQDPESPASQQLDAMTLQLAGESPELADAIRQKVLQKATMIVQKMGPQTDPSDPLKQQRVLTDPITQNRRDRFMRAIQNPAQALERLSSGHGSAEDLAIVRELTPMVHKRFVDGVMQQLVGGGHKLSLAQKQRLHRVLGQPVAREQTPAYVAFFSNLLGGKKPQQESQAMGQLPAERQGEFNSKEFAVDKHFGSRADALMGGTDD